MPDDIVKPEPTEEERQAAAIAAGEAAKAKFNASAGEPTAEEAAAAAAAAAEASEHTKPDHVPDKYWDAKTGVVNYEAWNTAHAELETKFHKAKEGETPEEKAAAAEAARLAAEAEADPTKKKEQQAILETPAAKTAAENYAANGELGEADYTALAAQGIDKAMVDSYIAGKEAQASILTDAAWGATDGEENYTKMVEWAIENVDEASIKAFNAQVQSGDPAVIKVASESLFKLYSENANVEGKRLGGGPPGNTSSMFESKREMTAAINKIGDDGRRIYDVDPAYRQEVQRKIGNSRKAGKVF